MAYCYCYNGVVLMRPSINGFSDKVRYSLDRTEDKGMRPLKWVTLVKDYPEV